MLQIRPEQIAAFSAVMRKRFEHRMSAYLRTAYAEQTEDMSDPAVLALIRKGIARARHYDIRRECDVQRYLDLMLMLHPHFDRARDYAWANEPLKAEGLSAEARLDKVFQLMEAHR